MKTIQNLKWWQFTLIILLLEGLTLFFAFVVLESEPCEVCPYIEKFGLPLFILFMIPIVMAEEFIFRFIPNLILTKLNFLLFALPVNIIVSIAFGLAHGGPKFILIQGFGGVALAFIYLRSLKYGHKKAYLVSTAYHFTYNLLVLLTP